MTITYESLVEDEKLPLRFVIFHLHPVSARLRFLLDPKGHIVFPKTLPNLSDVLEEVPSKLISSNLCVHPSQYVLPVSQHLGVDHEQLSIVSDLRISVDTPNVLMTVHYLRVTTEQPFAAPNGHAWIELPDCFQLIENERLLMKRLYSFYLD